MSVTVWPKFRLPFRNGAHISAREDGSPGLAPLRVLVVAPQPFFVPRGTPIAVRALAEGLVSEGWEVDLLAFDEGDAIEMPGVTLRRSPLLPGMRGVPPGFSLRKIAADAVMLPRLALLLARRRYDLVIAVEEAAYMAMLLGPIFRVPYICDVDSSIPEQIGDKYDLPGWVARVLGAVEARAARGALAAITCCPALERLMRDHAPGLPVQTLEDVTLIDPGADPAPPPDCRFEGPVLMYIGNLEGYQGVDLLLEGFARAVAHGAPGHLVIIGGAEAHVAALRAEADRLGLGARVALLGPRPIEAIGQYLAQATVVASPRVQGRNTPMKVYSYLDSGRPLLATRLPTHTQVLDDEIACLVDPSPDAMGRAIKQLFADAGLRARLAAAARRRVQAEYSPEAYRRKLSRFLRRDVVPRISSGHARAALEAESRG
ncbi:glycosyltransferase family 4 protein [Limimaricola sp.]|uniref:glycosyltransferase family 4 protein n=1 Tax=Limimaricola sp. TaxID=2211665 RepID=UPI004059DC32